MFVKVKQTVMEQNTLKDLIEKHQQQLNEIEKLKKHIEELNISINNLSDTNSEKSCVENLVPNQYHYVAKLDYKKTKILNVYIDRKTASLSNGYKNSTLDRIVKQKKMLDDHYYILYNECDTKLKQDFSDENGDIILYKNGIGRYDSEDCKEKFISKTHCCKDMKMCDKTLNKLIKNGEVYKEYRFKLLPDKIQMIE